MVLEVCASFYHNALANDFPRRVAADFVVNLIEVIRRYKEHRRIVLHVFFVNKVLIDKVFKVAKQHVLPAVVRFGPVSARQLAKQNVQDKSVKYFPDKLLCLGIRST